jgi:hypothetical protein
MNVSLLRRGLAAAAVVAASALIAVGCGGSGGGSGAADAAKNAKGLDYVPEDAVLCMTFDTDLEGDNWGNVDDLAPAFYDKVKTVDQYVEDASKDGKDEVNYKKDVEPWLGDSAGVAVTNADGDFMGWVDIKDRSAFEKFAKDHDFKKDGSAGDFDLWKDTSGDEEDAEDISYIALSDDLALLANGRKNAKKVAEFDGTSIKDADGIKDVVDKVQGDALFALVVNGDGARKALADSDDKQASKLADDKQVKKIDGLSLSFAAEDKGFRLHGFVGTDGLDEKLLGKNGSTKLFKDLPGDTMVAFGGNDLGGSISSLLDLVGETNSDASDAIGAFEGLLGVSQSDLEKALSDEWALTLSGTDDGFKGLSGTVMGAAMMGTGGLDPTALDGVSASLAFAANNDTKDTVEKLFGATQMATGTPPETGTAGDFDTLTATVGGMPVTAATSDDLAIITTGADVLEGWGSGDTLGDNGAFKDAWAAADAPDDVSSIMFLDWPRIAGIAGVKGSDKAEAGGWVAWSETDGDDASLDLFMHAEKN